MVVPLTTRLKNSGFSDHGRRPHRGEPGAPKHHLMAGALSANVGASPTSFDAALCRASKNDVDLACPLFQFIAAHAAEFDLLRLTRIVVVPATAVASAILVVRE